MSMKLNLNEKMTFVGENDYGGHGTKTAVFYDGERYLMKIPETVREKSDLGVSLHSVSEYISCHIAQSMGMECQDTILGSWIDGDGVSHDCCLCRDFTQGTNYKLAEVKAMCYKYGDMTDAERTALEEKPTFSRIEDFFSRVEQVDKETALQMVGETFVLDSFIGNTDRHTGNYGFLQDVKRGILKPAPIYDCGSSLFPTKDDEYVTSSSPSFLSGGVNSLIRESDDNIMRINYKAFLLGDNMPEYIQDAVLRLVPKINIENVKRCVLNAVPYISEVRAEALCQILELRYKDILLQSCKNLLSKDLPDISVENLDTRKIGEVCAQIKTSEVGRNIRTLIGGVPTTVRHLTDNAAVILDDAGKAVGWLDLRPATKSVIKTAATLDKLKLLDGVLNQVDVAKMFLPGRDML